MPSALNFPPVFDAGFQVQTPASEGFPELCKADQKFQGINIPRTSPQSVIDGH